ncbi:MAG: hypothetical protein QM736_01090 [Vicinamibacterales bacterium]
MCRHTSFRTYPGTGAASEIGYEGGAGRTVNLPLEAGATDEDYRLVFERVVLPVLRQFAPHILFVSAGFDAHERDPLGQMRVTTPGFAAMTAALRQVADEDREGRLVVVTEGGYDLRALRDCCRTVIDVLANESAPSVDWPQSPVASSRGRAAVTQTQAALTQVLDVLKRAVLRGVSRAANAGAPPVCAIAHRVRGIRYNEPTPMTRVQAATPRQEVAAGVDLRACVRSCRRRVAPEVLLPGDVRVSVRTRARRARPQLHHRRHHARG